MYLRRDNRLYMAISVTDKVETTETLKVAQNLIPETPHSIAKKKLRDDETPAQTVYTTVNWLLGKSNSAMDAWEFETIILTLNQSGVLLSELNQDKLQALIAVKKTWHTPMTSVAVFTSLCSLFNNETPDLNAEETLPAEHLAWGIRGLTIFLDRGSVFLDYQPIEYIADILFLEGFFIAPMHLEFAQDRLSSKNKNREMEDHVRSALKGYSEPTNDVVLEQINKHLRVKEYVKLMESRHPNRK